MHYSNPQKSINKLGSNVICPHPLSENGNKLHTVSAIYGGKSNTAQLVWGPDDWLSAVSLAKCVYQTCSGCLCRLFVLI